LHAEAHLIKENLERENPKIQVQKYNASADNLEEKKYNVQDDKKAKNASVYN
jgi:hypothetical protein